MFKNEALKTLAIAIIVISFIMAFAIYQSPCFPEMMASHWNIQGQADGYTPKFWGIFLMPIISAFLFSLFVFLPKIDPLKENYQGFRKYYDGFIFLIIAFLFYLYLLTILWNYGLRFNMTKLMIPAMAVLFYYVGVLLENAKRNWFVGIRTPWTLNNDLVWDKTHKLGARLFKIAGIIGLLGFFLPDYGFFLIIIPAISISLFLSAYSYLIHARIARG